MSFYIRKSNVSAVHSRPCCSTMFGSSLQFSTTSLHPQNLKHKKTLNLEIMADNGASLTHSPFIQCCRKLTTDSIMFLFLFTCICHTSTAWSYNERNQRYTFFKAGWPTCFQLGHCFVTAPRISSRCTQYP